MFGWIKAKRHDRRVRQAPPLAEHFGLEEGTQFIAMHDAKAGEEVEILPWVHPDARQRVVFENAEGEDGTGE